jgi:acyl dehydratase
VPHPPAVVGTELPPVTFEWQERDAILYALGVGARPPAELTLLYEGDGFTVLPTFALVANWWAVKDLGALVQNRRRPMVHAFQSLELTRTLNPRGQVKVSGHIAGVWEKGQHTLVEVNSEGVDEEGPLFTAASGTMILGLHDWGGTSGPAAVIDDPLPDTPMATVDDYVRPEQASIYRLCGDTNPLHIDPIAAQAAGFADVFLHGLCTMGFAARAIIRGVCQGEATRLQSISCRFSSPVGLDQPLRTDIWPLTPQEIAFQTNQPDGPALTRGRALLRTP